jgi:hypothetical protein
MVAVVMHSSYLSNNGETGRDIMVRNPETSTNSTMAAAAWRNSDSVCALADGERHLGHAIKIGGRWHAFDATHMNPDSNGFRFLGTFASVASAREAIEKNGQAGNRRLAGAA